jgi:hypothetical protein
MAAVQEYDRVSTKRKRRTQYETDASSVKKKTYAAVY